MVSNGGVNLHPYVAVSHYTLPGSQSLAVVCIAPPQSSRDGREVLVRLSLDGALFSVMGALFYYHAPVKFLAVSPESPASPLSGGLQIAIQLDYESNGGLFGPNFDPEQTTVPAGCAFGDIEVPAEYLPQSSQVTCVSPPVDAAAVRRRRLMMTSG